MEKSISAVFGYYGLGGEANNLGVEMNWGQVDGSDGGLSAGDNSIFPLAWWLTPKF